MRETNQLENAEEFTKLPNSWEERGKGLEQGLEQGIERSKEKEKEVVALKMLKEGLSIDVIAKITDLDKEFIEKLNTSN